MLNSNVDKNQNTVGLKLNKALIKEFVAGIWTFSSIQQTSRTHIRSKSVCYIIIS